MARVYSFRRNSPSYDTNARRTRKQKVSNRRYTRIDRVVIDRYLDEVGFEAVGIYMLLRHKANSKLAKTVMVALEDIADLCGIDPWHVWDHLNVLHDEGLITVALCQGELNIEVHVPPFEPHVKTSQLKIPEGYFAWQLEMLSATAPCNFLATKLDNSQ